MKCINIFSSTCILFFLSYNVFPQPTYSDILNGYVEKNYMTNQYDHLIYKIAKTYVEGSKFENKININSYLKADNLNIYVLSNDEKEVFTTLDCNCAYIDFNNTIVCDKKIFEYLENRLKLFGKKDSSLKLVETRFYYFLVQWVLGHEIAHVVLNHKIDQSNVMGEGLNESKKDSLSLLTYFQKENKADAFVIDHLDIEDEQNAYFFWLGISNMISTSYDNTLNAWLDKKKNKASDSIELVINTNQHPPWLLRYLDMVDLLLKSYPNQIVDSSNYFGFIREKIKIKKSTITQSNPLCIESKKEKPVDNNENENDSEPEEYNWYLDRAVTFFDLADFSRARSSFDKTLKTILKSEKLTSSLSDVLAVIYLRLGILDILDNKIDEAIINLNKSISYGPLSDSYLYLAICNIEKKDVRNIISLLSKSLSINKYNGNAYLLIASQFVEQNENEKAKAVIKYYNGLDFILNYNNLKYSYYFPKQTMNSIKSNIIENELFKDLDVEIDDDLFQFIYEYSFNLYTNKTYSKAIFSADKLIQYIENKQNKTINDTIKLADIYNFKGMIYNSNSEKKKSLFFYNLSLKLKSSLSLDKVSNINFLKGQTTYNIGNIYFNENLLDSCLVYYHRAEKYYNDEQNEDSYYKIEKNKLFYKVGLVYLNKGSVEMGLNYHLYAIKKYIELLNEHIRNEEIADLIVVDIELLEKIKPTKSFSNSELISIRAYKDYIFSILRAKPFNIDKESLQYINKRLEKLENN